MDLPAYSSALWTFCARNPGANADPNTSKIVGQLIHRASVKGLLWPVSYEVREAQAMARHCSILDSDLLAHRHRMNTVPADGAMRDETEATGKRLTMNNYSKSNAGANTALHEMLANGALLQALPIGVYCCEPDGTICNFNLRAAALWGRMPKIGDTDERFCGAHKLFLPDGRPLPHDETPMAEALRSGKVARDQKVIIERPDGSRVCVLVNIDPLYDKDGVLVGAVNCFQDISELTGLDTST